MRDCVSVPVRLCSVVPVACLWFLRLYSSPHSLYYNHIIYIIFFTYIVIIYYYAGTISLHRSCCCCSCVRIPLETYFKSFVSTASPSTAIHLLLLLLKFLLQVRRLAEFNESSSSTDGRADDGDDGTVIALRVWLFL